MDELRKEYDARVKEEEESDPSQPHEDAKDKQSNTAKDQRSSIVEISAEAAELLKQQRPMDLSTFDEV